MSPCPSQWHTIMSLCSFVLGACVGSFLNVCIHRIPRGIPLANPNRSFCPRCNAQIAWYDNLPLVSFFALRGRCRRCGGRIAVRYVLVEFLVAILFLLVWFKYDTATPRPLALVAVSDWRLVPVFWLAVSGLALGTFVDLEHLIIPDRVTLGGIVMGLVLSAAIPALHDGSKWLDGLFSSAIGAGVGWCTLWGVAAIGRLIFRKEAMGFGDVKLLGAIGAFFGWRAVFFTILVSSVAGSIVGLTLVLLRRKKLQSRIPYGPYLAFAAVLWMLWGPAWWAAYLNLLVPPGMLP